MQLGLAGLTTLDEVSQAQSTALQGRDRGLLQGGGARQELTPYRRKAELSSRCCGPCTPLRSVLGCVGRGHQCFQRGERRPNRILLEEARLVDERTRRCGAARVARHRYGHGQRGSRFRTRNW